MQPGVRSQNAMDSTTSTMTRKPRRERAGIGRRRLHPEHGISNGRVDGFNTKVRLIIRRAYEFNSAGAALALVMLAAGPINLKLPHERVVWKEAS